MSGFGCKIRVVKKNVFVLPLSRSQSLEHLDNIEKLDLSSNQLVWVGSGVFRGLSRLRQLYLHNNRLSVVQQGSLDLLPGLEACEEKTTVCVSSASNSVSLIFCPSCAGAQPEQQQHLPYRRRGSSSSAQPGYPRSGGKQPATPQVQDLC